MRRGYPTRVLLSSCSSAVALTMELVGVWWVYRWERGRHGPGNCRYPIAE